LTAYLDGHIQDEEIAELGRAIQEDPRLKARFQTELRLQTLMREAACARRELNGLSAGRIGPVGRQWNFPLWTALAASAACICFVVLLVFILQGRSHRAQPPIGRFLQVGGAARAPAGTASANLLVRDGQPVLEGDRIVCDANMRSLIELTDGTLLCLEGGSAITINRNQADDVEILVDRGKVLFEVTKRDANESRVVVKTPQATATVLGTLFSIEVQSSWTRADVYEGLVHFRQDQTGDEVQIGEEQCAETWGDGFLQVHELSYRGAALGSPEMVLSPTEDLYICDGRSINEDRLYVEGERRIIYLKFNVPQMKTFRTARLQLTQMFDVGKGTLSFHEGSHSRWTEQDPSMGERPRSLREVGRYSGVVGVGQTIDVDVSDLVKHPGLYTIVVALDSAGNDDIAFGSKEGPCGPKLILNEQWGPRDLDAVRTVQRDAAAQASPYTDLPPTDDAHLENGRRVNRPFLHVEEHRRMIFLRFEVPDQGVVQEARLQLSQTMDTGSGTIQFFQGSHSNWTELDLIAERAPKPVREIARYTSVVGPFDTISVDVSDLVVGPGVYTIIATLDARGVNDIAFGSKESSVGPRLAVKWRQVDP
jgi:ferric-dicitrate binding protein FerR (iron transport regulator)